MTDDISLLDVIKTEDKDLPDLEEIDFSDIKTDKKDIEEWLDNYLEKNDPEDLKEANSIWLDATLTGLWDEVKNPAQPSEWLAFKSQNGNSVKRLDIDKTFGTDKESNEDMISVAPVLVPNQIDKDGDMLTAPAIEKATTELMENFGERKTDIKFNHDKHDDVEGQVVRVWTTLEDRTFKTVDGDEIELPKSTLLGAVKHENVEDWDRVKSAEIEGFSIEGYSVPVSPEQVLEKLKDEGNESKDMTEEEKQEQEQEKADVEDLRGDLEQYNIDTDDMTDDDILEFAQGLLGDLEDTLGSMDEVDLGEDMDEDEDEEDEDKEQDENDAEDDTSDEKEEEVRDDEELKEALEKHVEDILSDYDLEKEQEEDKDEENPCWDGYEMMGLDENGDPICVPEEDVDDAKSMIKEEFGQIPEDEEDKEQDENDVEDDTSDEKQEEVQDDQEKNEDDTDSTQDDTEEDKEQNDNKSNDALENVNFSTVGQETEKAEDDEDDVLDRVF